MPCRIKGFLDLEGELPPILVSLVIKVERFHKGLHKACVRTSMAD